jgi:hypothetical protein
VSGFCTSFRQWEHASIERYFRQNLHAKTEVLMAVLITILVDDGVWTTLKMEAVTSSETFVLHTKQRDVMHQKTDVISVFYRKVLDSARFYVD